jgi:phosphoribosyl 1,2-cyclic phosphodiesterase
MSPAREEGFVISFHGVRGSTPCCGPELQRYGGNTSCVSIETPGHDPLVLDLGTGLRQWGRTHAPDACPTVHALVSHLHWDHVQGLPFFAPLHRSGTRLEIYGPGEPDETFGEAFGRFMKPPFFPIEPDQLIGDVFFHDVADVEFDIGEFRLMARPVPHTGITNGYRVERDEVSVAYVPDHQMPVDRTDQVADSVLDLCRDVDVLIHDAQFTPAEFEVRSNWGHCTIEYAIEVARQAGARTLVMFHHDPGHDDEEMDRLHAEAEEMASAAGLESVVAAAEGLKLPVFCEQ